MREISWVVCGSGPPPRRRRERCLTSRLLALASRWSIMNVLTDAVPLFLFLFFFKFSVAPIFFSLFFFYYFLGKFCPAVWTEGRQTESWSVAHLSYSVTDVGSNNKQQKEKKKGKNELIIFFFFCHKVYILFFHTDLQVTKTKRSSSVFFYDDDDYDLCSHLPTTFLPWK